MNEQNDYFLGFNVLNTVFENKDLYDGIINSFSFIKRYFDAGQILIYKYNNEEYLPLTNNNSYLINSTSLVLNHIVEKINCKDYFYYPCNDTNLKNVLFIPFSIKNTKYVLTIINLLNINNLKNNSLVLKKIFPVIINKYLEYDELLKSSSLDELTKLENRMAYSKKLREINNSNERIVYVLFDLFRLKYVNDNFTHTKGDEYIIKASNILKKYFPAYYSNENNHDERVKTGNYLYRIGGDEFALITSNLLEDNLKNKLDLAANEVKNIDLGVNDSELLLGLNYGIAVRNNQQNVEDLYLEADQYLSEDKKNTYKILGINRRR